MSFNDEIQRLKQELAAEKQKNQDLKCNIDNIVDKRAEEALREKNRNFVQLYKNELKELRYLAKSNSTAMQILLILVEKMNKQNALVISQKQLVKITGKTRQTVSTAIKVLKEHKFLTVLKIGTANAYIVNSNVFWQADKQSKGWNAIFTATVVATSSEQDKDFEDWKDVKLKQLPLLGEIAIEHDKDDSHKQQNLPLNPEGEGDFD